MNPLDQAFDDRFEAEMRGARERHRRHRRLCRIMLALMLAWIVFLAFAANYLIERIIP